MERYNGWANYETWNVKLWLDNEADEYWREQAKERFQDSEAEEPFTRSENARRALASELEDAIGESAQELLKAGKAESSMFADILGAALHEVNWDEIADAFLEDAEDDEGAKYETIRRRKAV